MTLGEFWGPLEADFQRFYAMDLRLVVGDEEVGCRRLHDLVAYLPPESMFKRLSAGSAQDEPRPERPETDPRKIAEFFQGLSG